MPWLGLAFVYFLRICLSLIGLSTTRNFMQLEIRDGRRVGLLLIPQESGGPHHLQGPQPRPVFCHSKGPLMLPTTPIHHRYLLHKCIDNPTEA
jgi:hypothetical protein